MNHEHYSDPTADTAIWYMSKNDLLPLVYICSPYRLDPKVNVMRARKFCRMAVQDGYLPIAPHLYFPQFISDDTERELAFRMNSQLMSQCHELWVFGKELSDGMKRELFEAKSRKMLIRYFDNNGKEVDRLGI
jgi:hypothetical protein